MNQLKETKGTEDCHEAWPQPALSAHGPRRVVVKADLVDAHRKARRKAAVLGILMTALWIPLHTGLGIFPSLFLLWRAIDCWVENFRQRLKIRRAHEQLAHGTATTGRVVAVIPAKKRKSALNLIEFFDQEGNRHTFERKASARCRISSSAGSYTTVLYNPHAPDKAVVVDDVLEYVHLRNVV